MFEISHDCFKWTPNSSWRGHARYCLYIEISFQSIRVTKKENKLYHIDSVILKGHDNASSIHHIAKYNIRFNIDLFIINLAIYKIYKDQWWKTCGMNMISLYIRKFSHNIIFHFWQLRFQSKNIYCLTFSKIYTDLLPDWIPDLISYYWTTTFHPPNISY